MAIGRPAVLRLKSGNRQYSTGKPHSRNRVRSEDSSCGIRTGRRSSAFGTPRCCSSVAQKHTRETMMSGLQQYGQHLLRQHASLRTELERLDGGSHEPAITEAEMTELLSGSPSQVRRTLKDLKQQIRQLESAVVDARTAYRDRLIEREGLPSEVKDLIGDQHPDAWWQKFGAAFDTHN